jgi:hypothetical protein
MGNSSITLQQIVDSASTIGDLNPILVNTGGFASEPALTIANDVVADMFSPRFPWKWNRIKLPPFATISRQQDYASLSQHNIGWLENGFRVDANSPQVPPLTWPIRVVRDLPVEMVPGGWPQKACWFPNNQLEQHPWPGPFKTYTNPVGNVQTPPNPPTNILDANGNILVLTKFGTTGAIPPVAPVVIDPDNPPPNWNDDWPIGAVIEDGTCEWTVAHPEAQGIRISPPPVDTGGNTWIIRLFAQGGGPYFETLQDTLDPIPNEDAKYFREGFVAYAHRYSANPNVKARYMQLKTEWQQDLQGNLAQGADEEENYGEYPAQALMGGTTVVDPGPGNPFWRGGR